MLKYVIILQTPKLFLKKFIFFFSSNVRMSGKKVIFDDKKIDKSNFCKNKKLFNIYDIKKKQKRLKKIFLNLRSIKIMMILNTKE